MNNLGNLDIKWINEERGDNGDENKNYIKVTGCFSFWLALGAAGGVAAFSAVNSYALLMYIRDTIAEFDVTTAAYAVSAAGVAAGAYAFFKVRDTQRTVGHIVSVSLEDDAQPPGSSMQNVSKP